LLAGFIFNPKPLIVRSMQVAIIGLGTIGGEIAKHWLAHDPTVMLWNRTPKQEFAANTRSLEQIAAQADVVLCYLQHDQAVGQVCPQLFAAMRKGSMFINHATISLECVQDCAKACSEAGIAYVDAPFTGSKLAARSAALVYYMAAGDAQTAEAAKSLLAVSSKQIIEFGAIGQPCVVKLATNLISAVSVAALSEAFSLATHNGIDAQAFIAAVQANACGSALSSFKLGSLAQGDFDCHFSLENMYKDSLYALQLAAAKNLQLPGIELVSGLMGEGVAGGLGKQDYVSLAKVRALPQQD